MGEKKTLHRMDTILLRPFRLLCIVRDSLLIRAIFLRGTKMFFGLEVGFEGYHNASVKKNKVTIMLFVNL